MRELKEFMLFDDDNDDISVMDNKLVSQINYHLVLHTYDLVPNLSCCYNVPQDHFCSGVFSWFEFRVFPLLDW